MYELLGGTPQRQRRIFATVGAVAIGCVVLLVAVLALLGAREPDDGRLHLTIESPDVGPGIKPGTSVTLRGVSVGSVKSIDTPSPGRVLVDVGLERGSIAGLTDALSVRFQPGNYFGVTELALLPRSGGATLTAGSLLKPNQSSDTISDLLTRSSVSVTGVLDQRLIDVTRKLSGYTQALTPLLEVAFAVERENARTATVPVGRTLEVFRKSLDGAPPVIDAAYGWFIELLTKNPELGTVVERYDDVDKTTGLLGTGFFGPMADLFGSHEEDFTPGSVMLRVIMDNTTKVMRTVNVPRQIVPLITGLNRSFVTVPQGTALKTDVVVERFPAAASVLPPGGR